MGQRQWATEVWWFFCEILKKDPQHLAKFSVENYGPCSSATNWCSGIEHCCTYFGSLMPECSLLMMWEHKNLVYCIFCEWWTVSSSRSCKKREIHIQSGLVGSRLYTLWNDWRKGQYVYFAAVTSSDVRCLNSASTSDVHNVCSRKTRGQLCTVLWFSAFVNSVFGCTIKWWTLCMCENFKFFR